MLESLLIAIPRGYGPTGIRWTSRSFASDTTLTAAEHQLDTIRYLPSGLTARYFGTEPTLMMSTILRVATEIL